jgi:hypothetical protein
MRVVAMLAWPSQAWTRAMSARWERALVAAEILEVSGRREILADQAQRHRRRRNEADLVALAFYAKMRDAFTLLQILDLELAELGPAKPMVEQRAEDRPVALPLERPLRRRVE